LQYLILLFYNEAEIMQKNIHHHWSEFRKPHWDGEICFLCKIPLQDLGFWLKVEL